MADIARIFWSGRSQAVRLPKEFRFDAATVRIRRDGDAVILEPVDDQWASLPRIPHDLADELLAVIEEDVPQQDRPGLDDL